MSAIDAKITALEAEIEQFALERNLLSPSDETKEARRDLLLAAITASRQNLHDLTLERRQQQQGKIFCKFLIVTVNLHLLFVHLTSVDSRVGAAASVLSGSVGTGGD